MSDELLLPSSFETELTIGPSAIDAYSRLSYTMWYALAEFVDNSTQSRLNYGNLIDDVLRAEGKTLEVSIVHDPTFKELRIEGNSRRSAEDRESHKGQQGKVSLWHGHEDSRMLVGAQVVYLDL